MKIACRQVRSDTRTLPTKSDQVERQWAPLVGPTALLLARLAMDAEVDDPGPLIGVKPTVAHKAAQRLVRFRLAEFEGDTLWVFSHQSPPRILARPARVPSDTQVA